jgi:hypothetical protein
METVEIPRTKIKDFLTSRLVNNVLQSDESTLFDILRYETIGGFEKMTDKELIDNLIKAIPEFNLLEFYQEKEHNIVLSVKEEYKKTSDEILVDIHRIIQTKL